MSKAYHWRAEVWFPGESTPCEICACSRYFAKGQRELRKELLDMFSNWYSEADRIVLNIMAGGR